MGWGTVTVLGGALSMMKLFSSVGNFSVPSVGIKMCTKLVWLNRTDVNADKTSMYFSQKGGI
jgi:hypothetical protein